MKATTLLELNKSLPLPEMKFVWRGNKYQMELTKDFSFNGVTYKKGTLTDFMTVPRIFTPLIPKVCRDTAVASLCHDQHYCNARFNLTRKEADVRFRDTILLYGLAPYADPKKERWEQFKVKFKAWAAYLGVRWGNFFTDYWVAR